MKCYLLKYGDKFISRSYSAPAQYKRKNPPSTDVLERAAFWFEHKDVLHQHKALHYHGKHFTVIVEAEISVKLAEVPVEDWIA